ncbi:hypothetical protein [Pandoraea morbifera]|uniref:hypothetical protein n=1 Tax=Pandoraea morbifera TaxID=2508300 RepID=UPI00123FC6A2|nr:hypothetical protein [Pandoraea morbifera]
MSNIYWPVFRNLEKSVDDLAFAIHIDDAQLNVYSSRITDLILRAAAEIESLAKELYRAHGGTKANDSIKFDDDAIKLLKTQWLLEEKKVILSSSHCFQSNRVLMPFVKNEARTSSATGKMTYSWNNAYQNLKHDRGNSMTFGSVRYLFDIMAALFVLNVYHRNETIKLGKDQAGLSFPLNLGSSLFSIELSNNPSHGPQGEFIKKPDFASSIYYVDRTPESGKIFQDSIAAFNVAQSEVFSRHPKIIEFVSKNDVSNYQGNLAWEVLGQDECLRIVRQVMSANPIAGDKLEYVALLNKNVV